MKYWLLILSVILFISCNNDSNQGQASNEINIRLPMDPQRINPFFASTALGREVFQYSFLSCADYHPQSLELYPILLEEIPTGKLSTYKGEEVLAFEMAFKKDATWSDGTTITNQDYAFTLKVIKHPQSHASGWRPLFNFLKGVELDPEDNKRFTVYFDKSYMLALESAITINLMPKHLFDKENKFAQLSISQLSDPNYVTEDSTEINLLKTINESVNHKTEVVQVGPYKMTAYETDQYIILEKIDNHWSQNYPDNPFLQSKVDKIVFKIIPDELTAITMAKEEKIDLMMMRSSNSFLELKDDPSFNKNWSFHVPQLMRYYYLAINNKDEILQDKLVRNAVSRIVDIPDIIESIEGGLGVRTIGHFHPTKSYYNDKLKPIEFDLKEAKQLLDRSGWKDTNDNGILDKQINGKLSELSLDILITGSSLSKNIALLVQDAGRKIGIEINLVTKKSSLMRKENLYPYKYHMALLVVGIDHNPSDPYRRWHSDNAYAEKGNILGYNNPEVDVLIDELRLIRDNELRREKYLKIQELMYFDQPAVFLYCPLNKIIISNKFKASSTSKRPGYLANTFQSMN